MSTVRADCAAAPEESGERLACARCGLAWLADAAHPPCDPITFETLRLRLASECAAAEASLALVGGLEARGLPTDGGATARRRLAELEAAERLIARVAGDADIKKRLNAGSGGA